MHMGDNVYVMGIDGGGTKTNGVIASASGEIMAEATVGPTNPNNGTKADLERELAKLFHDLRRKSNGVFENVKHVYAGMSGVGHTTAKNEMEKLIRSLLPETVKLTVSIDALIALYSGTLGKPGIVQIAGTGSITFGINEEGVSGRVGGWGHFIGETGSGFAIGKDGLAAAFSAHDGLGKETEITNLIAEHFQTASLPDIVHTVYHHQNTKELLASLSKLVIQAADNDDAVAMAVIRKHGFHIGESIACLIKRLFPGSNDIIPVVCIGGLFNRMDLFQSIIEEVLRAQQITPSLVRPTIQPVGGAVVAALQEEKIRVENDFLDRFMQ